MKYLVTWEINIEAQTPQEAAKQDLAIQRDAKSLATVFQVYSEADDDVYTVDLLTPDEKET